MKSFPHKAFDEMDALEKSAYRETTQNAFSPTLSQNLQNISEALTVSEDRASEDLWYDFLKLKKRRLWQQKAANISRADQVAYYKMREIILALQARDLRLPGVNIIKSMNAERTGLIIKPKP